MTLNFGQRLINGIGRGRNAVLGAITLSVGWVIARLLRGSVLLSIVAAVIALAIYDTAQWEKVVEQ